MVCKLTTQNVDIPKLKTKKKEAEEGEQEEDNRFEY